jgi:hypothetical protein
MLLRHLDLVKDLSLSHVCHALVADADFDIID